MNYIFTIWKNGKRETGHPGGANDYPKGKREVQRLYSHENTISAYEVVFTGESFFCDFRWIESFYGSKDDTLDLVVQRILDKMGITNPV